MMIGFMSWREPSSRNSAVQMYVGSRSDAGVSVIDANNNWSGRWAVKREPVQRRNKILHFQR